MFERLTAKRAEGRAADLNAGALVRALAAVAAVAIIAGCAARTDKMAVGAIPDDYRTNHPIVISEKDEVLDLPVAPSSRGATKQQRESLEGFLHRYDRSAKPVLTIVAPSGSANEMAARHVARDFARIARASGVPESRIAIAHYQASPQETIAPVRVTFKSMRAQAGPCGHWPEDALQTNENRHYANFGCAYQKNLAAQIANPADLLGPRKETEIDAENRGVVIQEYRKVPAGWSETIGF